MPSISRAFGLVLILTFKRRSCLARIHQSARDVALATLAQGRTKRGRSPWLAPLSYQIRLITLPAARFWIVVSAAIAALSLVGPMNVGNEGMVDQTGIEPVTS